MTGSPDESYEHQQCYYCRIRWRYVNGSLGEIILIISLQTVNLALDSSIGFALSV